MYSYFKFTKTKAVNDRFEAFGYEVSNFMELTGGLFINQCLAVMSFIISMLLIMLVIRYKEKFICR